VRSLRPENIHTKRNKTVFVIFPRSHVATDNGVNRRITLRNIMGRHIMNRPTYGMETWRFTHLIHFAMIAIFIVLFMRPENTLLCPVNFPRLRRQIIYHLPVFRPFVSCPVVNE
jgi:hypothetical protein